MELSLQVGADVIRSYRRLSYTPWHALGEFIDNSTQSYFNHRAELTEAMIAAGEPFEVRIVYDRENGLLRVSDNAMGMDSAELKEALRIGAIPRVVSGRSQYGLGMKTAACWFGSEWSIRTTKLGSPDEVEVTIDVEAVASGNIQLPTVVRDVAPEEHGTILEIRGLHTKLYGRTIGKIKTYLASMYRVDLREQVMSLYWEGTPLSWDSAVSFLQNKDGHQYKKDFDFTVDGKRVWGFVGILGEGSSGRPQAGFSILRRGRMIKGHPESWRPESIFGQVQGSNNLINQRISGELHLDDFEVSHTKDDILWQADEEEQVQEALATIAADFIAIARKPWKSKEGTKGPSDPEVQAAVEEVRGEVESERFIDALNIVDVPSPDLVRAANAPALSIADRENPRMSARIGEMELDLFLSWDESPNDPYVAADVAKERVVVVVNMNHPHLDQVEASEGFANYLRHCVYDACAEWKCRRASAPLEPDTIKLIKDGLLRVAAVIDG